MYEQYRPSDAFSSGYETSPAPDVLSIYQGLVIAMGAKFVANQITPTGKPQANIAKVVQLDQYRDQDGGGAGAGGGGEDGGGESEPERPNRDLVLQVIRTATNVPQSRPWMAEDESYLAEDAAVLLDDASWLGSEECPQGREIGRVVRLDCSIDECLLGFTLTYLNQEAALLAEALTAAGQRSYNATLMVGIYGNTNKPKQQDGVVHALEMGIRFPKQGPAEWQLAATPHSLIYPTEIRRVLTELGLSEFKGRALDESGFDLSVDREEAILRRVNVFLRRYLPLTSPK